jgi:ferric-dicitrate binding protein FerR (iron transport regulator)
MENISEEIFSRILDNSATEAEKEGFYHSLEKDPGQRGLYCQYKNLYTVSGIREDKFKNLQRDSFERFWEKANPPKKYTIGKTWYRYAAVLVLSLTLGYLIRYYLQTGSENQMFARMIEYTSEKGSVSTIHLEDGSSIWLSTGSRITIEKGPKGQLAAKLDGEAYFDLVPDPSRKFVVDLGYFKIEDIGTRFNVRAYSAEKKIYTTLLDGKVDLYKEGKNSILSMNPGEHMQYEKETSQISVSKEDTSIAIAWKDGKFVFIDKTLSEICRELENWYNVEIIIGNQTLANTRYTSVIKRTTTVNMVMKMLSLTDKINFKISERKEGRDIVYIY